MIRAPERGEDVVAGSRWWADGETPQYPIEAMTLTRPAARCGSSPPRAQATGKPSAAPSPHKTAGAGRSGTGCEHELRRPSGDCRSGPGSARRRYGRSASRSPDRTQRRSHGDKNARGECQCVPGSDASSRDVNSRSRRLGEARRAEHPREQGRVPAKRSDAPLGTVRPVRRAVMVGGRNAGLPSTAGQQHGDGGQGYGEGIAGPRRRAQQRDATVRGLNPA